MPLHAESASRIPRETSSGQRQSKKTCTLNLSSNFVTKNSKVNTETEVQAKSSVGFIRASHLQEVLTALTNWSAKFESKVCPPENVSDGRLVTECKIKNVSETVKFPLSNNELKSQTRETCRVPQKNVLLSESNAYKYINSAPKNNHSDSDFVCVKLDNRPLIAEKHLKNPCTAGRSNVASVQSECKGSETHEVPKRMSLLEQKRLQWAAERAQMREWDPWGKPGGGAPHAGGTESRQANAPESKDWTKANNCNYRLLTSPLQISVCDEFNQQNGRLPPLPQTATSPNVNSVTKPIPTALASSLSFGLTGPNNNYDSWKEEAKKHWLNELDKQREEQRLKRLEEKGYYSKMLLSNNINAHVSLNNLSLNSKMAAAALSPPEIEYAPTLPTLNKRERTLSTSPTSNNVDCGDMIGSNPSFGSQRTFLRGANIPLDAKTQLELTKRREKALEQQKVIKHQLEERLRLKQQEQERQKKEEFEEEVRLAKEREHLEEQFLYEQQQRALKEEAQNQQRETIIEAINVARKSAEVTKERKYAAQLPDVLDGTGSGHATAEKEVLQAANLCTSTKNSLTVPSENTAPYIFNRVLTPTKYRDRNLLTRDCSTQTDFPTTGHIPYKKDMATITGDLSKGQNSDAPSVGSSTSNTQKNAKSKSRSSRKKINKKERPQWGASQAPPKKQPPQMPKPPKPVPQSSPTEAAKTAMNLTKNGSRRFSGSKTRSSAEHQRKIIAQERSMALNSQRICLSPLPAARPMATDSSTTGDEVANLNQPTRRRRRQWESPGRDEMPTFYTNSPLLPDVRNVRRVSVSSSSNSSPPKLDPNVSQANDPNWAPPPSPPPQPFRSDSPPVPALRHKLSNATTGFQDLPSLATESKPKTSGLSRAQSPSGSHLTEAVNKCDNIMQPEGGHAFGSLEINPGDANSRNWHAGSVDLQINRRSSTPPFLQNERGLSSSWSLGTPSLPNQRADILKKLTLIRHGLLLRQQELDSILASQENWRNERQEKEANDRRDS